ncbi:hypothetical protein G8770_11670 [Aestuariicella hydrocarbonica]|uniref:Transposase n=1 Tax=Pseudomaricurvus hydrocarbonicus TaxID=1470433 RepID=A0A9E5MM39_9GAMM|nr:hypothetical protein [Aestuariicella hydrocarbonica]NHO66203.1 hypothetical protein [Aestuariicella hydrocarbonica]
MRFYIDELFFEAIKKQAYAKRLILRDHLSIDGTLLEACASMKSFKPKHGSGDDDDDFSGMPHSNKTHTLTTDAGAKFYWKNKGTASKLCHMAHRLTENRNGLIVETEVPRASTKQEWDAGTTMLARQGTTPELTVVASTILVSLWKVVVALR